MQPDPEDDEANWMTSGVSAHWQRNFTTKDSDRQMTKDDAADISSDDPKSIDAFGFYMGWISAADFLSGKAPAKFFKSGDLVKLVPFSTNAYHDVVTVPEEEAAKKLAEEEAAKKAAEAEEEEEDGA